MKTGVALALLLAGLHGQAGAAPVRDAPVDARADARTRAEFAWLRQTWGRHTIAGQQDLTWNDGVDMTQRVLDATGKYPALMGFDFMNTWSTGDGAHQVDEAIAWARRGGLVTFCWHWRDPSAPAGTQGNFYAREPDARKNTAFTIPVRDGRLDTGSAAGRALDADIDRLAVQLAKLRAAGVTVLWRPLHEASGDRGDGWFWWGRKRTDGVPNAQAYVLLYRHLFDRLVNGHGLHNLIWVWNGQDAAWYPGDVVVDIVGYDVYDDADGKTYKSQVDVYRRMAAIGAATKPVALSENSYIPDPDNMRRDGARWLWFLTWNDGRAAPGAADRNNFWSGDYYNTAAHKTKVYHDPDVITLDRLPAFLKAPQ
ncbi:glycosyl hydrolase [Massilia rhizosphaerae]|uniref:glycosyl hydrolase n=1 Tax=Massilia rhizosphaerae TaxID=2784389 RepID=UPI0018DE322B